MVNIFSEPIAATDLASQRAATQRQAQLTKPRRSLARLEQLAIAMAAIQGQACPEARPAAALLFASDHPVARHGVSAYPAAVTRAMLTNLASGGAAAAVLCEELRIPLTVIDVGVRGGPLHPEELGRKATVLRHPVAEEAAGDIRVEDAMTPDVLRRAVDAGARAVDALGSKLKVLILGEIGIGNTTVAAAVGAALLRVRDPGGFVGRGTGIDDRAFATKLSVVREAVARVPPASDPAEILRRVGGRDLAALFGAILGAARRRVTVLVDGLIVTTAALAAVRARPEALPYLVFAHRSPEPAHEHLLAVLDAEPMLDLGLRLGEGSGALLAFPLVELACALHRRMATFASAGVPDREECR